MNHLHEIFEALQQGRCLCRTDIDDGQAASFTKLLKENGRRAICFELGPVDLVTTMDPVPDLVRLPYPVCWFEGTVVGPERTVILGALAQQLDPANSANINCLFFTRGKAVDVDGAVGHGRSWLCMGYFELRVGQEKVGVGASPPPILEDAKAFALWIGCFLSALHCVNVQRVELPPPSAALQRARAKKGKAPLFSTWTLDIVVPHTKQASRPNEGGTHSSPRVHLRRGHPRQHSPGRWTWVQPHVVGNRSIGMVHKDYRGVPQINN